MREQKRKQKRGQGAFKILTQQVVKSMSWAVCPVRVSGMGRHRKKK